MTEHPEQRLMAPAPAAGPKSFHYNDEESDCWKQSAHAEVRTALPLYRATPSSPFELPNAFRSQAAAIALTHPDPTRSPPQAVDDRNRPYWTSRQRRTAKRWGLTLVVGVLTGLCGMGITFGSSMLARWKFATVNALLEQERLDGSAGGGSFFVYLFFNLAYVSVATFMVYIEPVAAGSGIPEIKCYLNGIDVPRVVDLKTLFCKVRPWRAKNNNMPPTPSDSPRPAQTQRCLASSSRWPAACRWARRGR